MSQRLTADGLALSGGDYGVVAVVAVIALVALVVGYVLLKEVLAAGQGTPKMQEIAKAVQEGAAAYLNRQFRTLAIFAVVVFLLLFALPADTCRRAHRPLHLLPDRCRVLRGHRLPRHVAGHPGERSRRRGRQHRGPRAGHADRVSAPVASSA